MSLSIIVQIACQILPIVFSRYALGGKAVMPSKLGFWQMGMCGIRSASGVIQALKFSVSILS